jgi:hypothetical protein
MERQLHSTADKAKDTMTGADEMISLAKDLLDDVNDGVAITFELPDDFSIADFITGKANKLPLKIWIEPAQDVD